MLDTYLKWFVAHERLIIIAAVLAVGFMGTTKYIDYAAHKADIEASVSAKDAAAQKAIVDQMTATMAQHDAVAQQERAAKDAEIATLVQTIVARDAATQKKVVEVTAPKTPPEAVADLNAAYPALPTPLVATDSGANVPTVDLQQFTATKLLSDACSADLTDTKEQLSDSQANTASALTQVADRDKLIGSMKTEDDKNAKAWKDEKDALVKDARRSKWKTFWAGVAVGFLGREAIKP
jgi:preprotein translocase subunit SecF